MPAPITIPTIMATASKKARLGFGEVASLVLSTSFCDLWFTGLLTLTTLAELN